VSNPLPYADNWVPHTTYTVSGPTHHRRLVCTYHSTTTTYLVHLPRKKQYSRPRSLKFAACGSLVGLALFLTLAICQYIAPPPQGAPTRLLLLLLIPVWAAIGVAASATLSQIRLHPTDGSPDLLLSRHENRVILTQSDRPIAEFHITPLPTPFYRLTADKTQISISLPTGEQLLFDRHTLGYSHPPRHLRLLPGNLPIARLRILPTFIGRKILLEAHPDLPPYLPPALFPALLCLPHLQG
jgi:hypothetical protein